MELTWAGKLHERGRKEGAELGRKEGLLLGRKEGAELGRKEGLLLGRQEGADLGRKEGVELGRQKGLATSRRMLQLILEQRFGKTKHELAGRLGRIDDLALLESISRRALADAPWDEIEKLMR